MMSRSCLLPACFSFSVALSAQTVTLVNIVPAAASGESFQQSEASLAVDPKNLNRMAIATMTNDVAGGEYAPIYVSLNGGSSWALMSVIPALLTPHSEFLGSNYLFVDPAVSFGVNNWLYAALLRGTTGTAARPIGVFRKSDLNTSATKMTQIGTGRTGVDQPFVQAVGVNNNTTDLVIVGSDDITIDSTGSGKTAAVDQYNSGSNSFSRRTIESRSTSNRDGAPIRIAMLPGGKAYGAFLARRKLVAVSGCSWNYETDVVVVRDDLQGTGTRTFSSLKGSDNNAGRIVEPKVFLPRTRQMGQDRVGYDAAIAVHPGIPNRVYLAWADVNPSGCVYRLHIRRSTDGGVSWSGDLGAARSNAKNPALAVNANGVVALLYQRLTGSEWQTSVDYTSTDFTSVQSVLLARHPSNQPARVYLPYLGDYTQMLAIGNKFYGVFTAGNRPLKQNFHANVTFLRKADWTGGVLLDTLNAPHSRFSMDPFFFTLTPP
jgi:hypothetical protein